MKVLVVSDRIPVVGPMLAALGMSTVFDISVPQGNKYRPHQSAKEKARRLRRLAFQEQPCSKKP